MAYTLGSPIRLESKQLVLRSMMSADITPAFVAWLSDPEVNEHLFQIPPQARQSPEQLARGFVATADHRSRFLLGIFLKSSGQQIGYVRFIVDPGNRRCVPTLVIGDKAWWKKAIPLRVWSVLTPFLFGELGLHKIVVTAYPENEAVIRLLGFAKYVQEGHFREHEWTGTRFRDVLQFGKLASEWRSGKTPY